LNSSAKFHQNWSLQFWAIPFQSWCIFWDTVYYQILQFFTKLLAWQVFANVTAKWYQIY